MLHAARHWLGSDDLAWDAVQEALYALWFEPTAPAPAALRTWLLRAVRHRSLHILRSRQRRQRHEQACACLRCWFTDEEPDRGFQRAEAAREVWAAMARLPREYRRVIESCDIRGLDYATTATELGVAVGTVRSRLHRARKLIGRWIRERAASAKIDGYRGAPA